MCMSSKVTKWGCIYISDNWIYTTLLSYPGANFTAPPYCYVPLFLPDTITRSYKNVTTLHKWNDNCKLDIFQNTPSFSYTF